MPKIEVSYNDLCDLIGKKIDMKTFMNDDILYAKGEVDDVVGDTMKLDIKDANRPDLWSIEGVAREIRYRYKGGFPDYKLKKSGVVVNVDKSVEVVRPLTVCAVVRGVKITENILLQLIQLQEKVSGTFGRNRKEVAIGVYDLGKIKSPINYTTVSPQEIKFIPLDFEKELTPLEILDKHPKGKEFGHLLKGAQRYPIFIDSSKNVLSIPPIINSAHTGKVTNQTKDVFIECSGFDFRFLIPSLNVIVSALAERGGKIETVSVKYGNKTIETPDLTPQKFSLDLDYVNKVSGLHLDKKSIIDLLERSGYEAKITGNKITVLYPAYRQDIMHASDVVEDIILTYGYNKIEPQLRKLPTKGKPSNMEIFITSLSEILVGCGLQEILSYTLTNKSELFEKMNLEPGKIAEIENPMSINWGVFRNWILPSIIEFFSKNKHVEYPQKIFEIGNCIVLDEKAETKSRDIIKLSVGISNSSVNYEDISALLDALMRNIKLNYSLRKHDHKSFIPGRCAEIIINDKTIGVIGEIHPLVLNKWKLEKPVTALEIDVSELFRIKYKL